MAAAAPLGQTFGVEPDPEAELSSLASQLDELIVRVGSILGDVEGAPGQTASRLSWRLNATLWVHAGSWSAEPVRLSTTGSSRSARSPHNAENDSGTLADRGVSARG